MRFLDLVTWQRELPRSGKVGYEMPRFGKIARCLDMGRRGFEMPRYGKAALRDA